MEKGKKTDKGKGKAKEVAGGKKGRNLRPMCK